MGKIFDFSDIEKSENAIHKTWGEFRDCLAKGLFTYEEIDRAKEQAFLKTYDDLFRQHSGIEHKTTTIKDIKYQILGRGTKLKADETPNHDRFLPKKEYIKEDNRFSPPGVEWLYLAIGNEDDIHKCAAAECRTKNGDRFGFCHFQFDSRYDDCKLVDLTIADDISYAELNCMLEEYGQAQVKKGIKLAKALGYVPQININKAEFAELFTRWGVYTHTKLLSEQIFIPLDATDNKAITYAPFQTMAQYYISLGYSGIIYGSTVCSVGKNIVLFDKQMAHPIGAIEDYRIS